jgi:alanine-glyoxylate transaminase/serine-glyoxylate transaminase/serine-pyruvate transaminase
VDTGLLLIPGPTPLHPLVQEELGKAALPHYGDAWIKAYAETLDLMRYVWEAPQGKVFPLVGPGHAGLESLAFTFLKPRDRVIVLDNGFFGQRVAEVLRTHGLRVDLVASEWGHALDLAKLRKALAKPAKAVALIHNETSTGVTNRLEEVLEMAHAKDAFVLVDAVSSLGGIPLRAGRLGIDAAFSASQKCLAAPAGISPILVAPSLWEATDPKGARGWYLNLFTWDHYQQEWGDWHPTPTTISSNLFYAVRLALALVKEEGLEARFQRHAKMAARMRTGLVDLGFEPVAAQDLLSNTVTCMRPPAGVEATSLVKGLKERHNIFISGGLGPLRGKTIRIGTMGAQAEPAVVDRLLGAMKSLV